MELVVEAQKEASPEFEQLVENGWSMLRNGGIFVILIFKWKYIQVSIWQKENGVWICYRQFRIKIIYV